LPVCERTKEASPLRTDRGSILYGARKAKKNKSFSVALIGKKIGDSPSSSVEAHE
jgi:hypothetical protein